MIHADHWGCFRTSVSFANGESVMKKEALGIVIQFGASHIHRVDVSTEKVPNKARHDEPINKRLVEKLEFSFYGVQNLGDDIQDIRSHLAAFTNELLFARANLRTIVIHHIVV